mmetsp:Transcript_36406/g.89712  ORF Transcript_36406/g.89712 Transcript_36406/m.89712 type:complete len:407 (+) Transcript_36406:352-1572(+)
MLISDGVPMLPVLVRGCRTSRGEVTDDVRDSGPCCCCPANDAEEKVSATGACDACCADQLVRADPFKDRVGVPVPVPVPWAAAAAVAAAEECTGEVSRTITSCCSSSPLCAFAPPSTSSHLSRSLDRRRCVAATPAATKAATAESFFFFSILSLRASRTSWSSRPAFSLWRSSLRRLVRMAPSRAETLFSLWASWSSLTSLSLVAFSLVHPTAWAWLSQFWAHALRSRPLALVSLPPSCDPLRLPPPPPPPPPLVPSSIWDFLRCSSMARSPEMPFLRAYSTTVSEEWLPTEAAMAYTGSTKTLVCAMMQKSTTRMMPTAPQPNAMFLVRYSGSCQRLKVSRLRLMEFSNSTYWNTRNMRKGLPRQKKLAASRRVAMTWRAAASLSCCSRCSRSSSVSSYKSPSSM